MHPSTVLAIAKLQEQTGHTVSPKEMEFAIIAVIVLVVFGLLKKVFS